jgi:hypothetical protein
MASFPHCWHCTDPFTLRTHELTSTKVFLFPSHTCATSTKGLHFNEVETYQGSTPSKLQAQSSNRPCDHDHELWRLGGVVKAITISVGDSSSFLMRQASRVAAYLLLYWANGPWKFRSSNSPCLGGYSSAGHTRELMEIKCSRESFLDCRLWSIIRLIDGKQDNGIILKNHWTD